MSRNLDLYAIERRAGHVTFILALWIVRASVLTRYRAGDVARKFGRAR